MGDNEQNAERRAAEGEAEFQDGDLPRQGSLEKARCIACKYPLRGLPSDVARCPECGRTFDLRDSCTYDDGSLGPKWLRWAKPPGLIHFGLVAVLCAQMLRDATYPFDGFFSCGTFLLLPLVGVYLFRVVLSIGFWLDRIPLVRRRSSVWWLPTPILLLLVVVLVHQRAPFRIRFAHSRPALEAEARLLLTATPTSAQFVSDGRSRICINKQLGWYFVSVVDVDYSRQHVYFNIGWGIRPHGLVYTGDSTEPPFEDYWREPYLPDNWARFAEP